MTGRRERNASDLLGGLFGLFKVTRAAFGTGAGSTNSNLLQLQVRGVGDEGNDDGAEAADDQAALQQFGVAIKPLIASTLRALALRWGVELWTLKIWDKAKLPTDLEDGETRVYSVGNNATRIRLRNSQGMEIDANGAVIAIDANGKISLTPASGQDVVVNAGTLKIARVSDGVGVCSLSGTAGPYPVQFIVTPTQADGTPGAPVGPSASASIAGVILNSGGAAHGKA